MKGQQFQQHCRSVLQYKNQGLGLEEGFEEDCLELKNVALFLMECLLDQ